MSQDSPTWPWVTSLSTEDSSSEVGSNTDQTTREHGTVNASEVSTNEDTSNEDTPEEDDSLNEPFQYTYNQRDRAYLQAAIRQIDQRNTTRAALVRIAVPYILLLLLLTTFTILVNAFV